MVFIFENLKYPVEGRYCAVMCNGEECSFCISSTAEQAKASVTDVAPRDAEPPTDVVSICDAGLPTDVAPILDAIASSALTPLTTIRMLLEKNALYYYDTKAPYPRKVLCIADGGYVNSPTFIGFGGLKSTALARAILAVAQYLEGVTLSSIRSGTPGRMIF